MTVKDYANTRKKLSNLWLKLSQFGKWTLKPVLRFVASDFISEIQLQAIRIPELNVLKNTHTINVQYLPQKDAKEFSVVELAIIIFSRLKFCASSVVFPTFAF